MDWIYIQDSGSIYHGDTLVQKKGYSGKGIYKNKPKMEDKVGLGPIPAGKYTISAPRTSDKTGPYVLPLTPVGHTARGRTAFQIHGDSINDPGNASSGCIILWRTTREKIWDSGDKTLIVKSTEDNAEEADK